MRQLGWTTSRVVREGVRLVAISHLPCRRRRIIGLGEFDFAIPDLEIEQEAPWKAMAGDADTGRQRRSRCSDGCTGSVSCGLFGGSSIIDLS